MVKARDLARFLCVLPIVDVLIILIFGGFPIDAVARGSGQKGQRTGDFYVAVNGSDRWSGQLDQPNRTNTDGPFATLARARDAVRALIRQGDKQGILLLIRGGAYSLKETVVFSLEDSAPPGGTITYAAYGDETPVFTSAVPIVGWISRGIRRRCCPRSPVTWCGPPMFPRVCRTS